jgi:hypothetical protein
MCHLPTLPRRKELVSELGPIHARLSHESSNAKYPVYRCSEVQVITIFHIKKNLMFLFASLLVFLVTKLHF